MSGLPILSPLGKATLSPLFAIPVQTKSMLTLMLLNSSLKYVSPPTCKVNILKEVHLFLIIFKGK